MIGRNAHTRLAPFQSAGGAERAHGGFTLIELLAVVGFTAVLMLFAVDFYLEITRASEAATHQTRGSRRAIALLDRIARDLEAAVLVSKPDEVDPLYHPWVFLAEDRGGGKGAEHLKFTTRGRIPRSTALHESDLEVVSYVLREGEDGGLELHRWSSPQLPEELDRSFPASDVEGAFVFADDLASFGVRFMDDSSEWKDEWDSSTLVDSSELPVAAEISVAILPEDAPRAEEEPEVYLRRVLIPVRPLDLQALLGASSQSEAGADEEEHPDDGECVTVGECALLNPDAFDGLRAEDPSLATVIDSVRDQCFASSALASRVSVEGCQ